MSDTPTCRICLEDTGILIQPCGCKGSTANVHEACLKRWVEESNSQECEICKEPYARRDVVGCNVTNYLNGLFRSDSGSTLETALFRISALHAIVGILMYAWSDMEHWMLITSVQTVAHTLCLIMFQIYHKDKPFFVLRVLIHWSSAYLMAICVVGIICTIDNEEECELSCLRLQNNKGCSKECVVYSYYTRKDQISSDVMFLRFVEFVGLISICCVALCFTHMRRSQYYSFSSAPLRAPSEEGSESDPFLASVEIGDEGGVLSGV
jgi:hypothetical protein